MRVVIGTLLLAGLCGSSVVHADMRKAAAPQAAVALSKIDRSRAGTPAPTIPFEAKGGKVTSLAAFRGRPVLVNLWATWCAPCKAEMPELDALATARAGKLTVLAISADLEGWRAVDKFFVAGRFKTVQPWLDQPGNWPQAMGARGLPVSILYDAQGREVWRVSGPLKWLSPQVQAAIG